MSTNKSSKYSKLYRLDSNLYNPNCAIAIKAGALFRNTENGKLHIQLKFQNLCEKTVLYLKVKILLKDSIGRVLSSTENNISTYAQKSARNSEKHCDFYSRT